MYRVSSAGIVFGLVVGVILLLLTWMVDQFADGKLLKSIPLKIGLVVITICMCSWLGINWGYYIREGNYSNHKCGQYVSDKWSDCDSPASYCVHVGRSSNRYYCKEHAEKAQETYDFYIDIATRKGSDSDAGTGSSSGSSKSRTCKSCGRSFKVGDSAGNSSSIAKSGMCNNCYRNFKSMTGK